MWKACWKARKEASALLSSSIANFAFNDMVEPSVAAESSDLVYSAKAFSRHARHTPQRVVRHSPCSGEALGCLQRIKRCFATWTTVLP